MSLFSDVNALAKSHPNIHRRSAAASVLSAALVGVIDAPDVEAHVFWDRAKKELFIAVKYEDEPRWNVWETQLQHHPERGWPSLKVGERDAFGSLHPRGHAYAFKGPDGLMLKIKNRNPLLVPCDLQMACFEALVEQRSAQGQGAQRTAPASRQAVELESHGYRQPRRASPVPALLRAPMGGGAMSTEVGPYRTSGLSRRSSGPGVRFPARPAQQIVERVSEHEDFTEQDLARLRGAIPARYRGA